MDFGRFYSIFSVFKREALHYQPYGSLPEQSTVHAIAFSPDGTRMAVANDKEIVIWRLSDMKPVEGCDPKSPTRCMVWLDNDHLLSGTGDGNLLCITKQTSPRPRLTVTQFAGHQHPISSIDVDRLSPRCATTAGEEVGIWSHSNGCTDWLCDFYLPEPPKFAHNQDVPVKALSAKWAQWQDNLLVSYENHGVVLWNTRNSQTIRSIERNGAYISLAPPTSSAEQLVAMSTSSLGVDVYDIGSGRACGTLLVQTQIQGAIEESSPISFAHDGLAVLGGGYDGDLHLWDVDTRSVVQVLRHDGPVTALSTFYRYHGDIFYTATATEGQNNKSTVRFWKTVDIGVCLRAIR
ncbi:WD40 repeat-like protein [Pluteus cervinus]|uniref:WD40 repeat-like protein n=1 Tax=Pluteus cervinus TaxID=181527 RepID=A0ACD3A7R0_9AGAR|nr:WD40 repeat-like protein [Pluteus cervinus]